VGDIIGDQGAREGSRSRADQGAFSGTAHGRARQGSRACSKHGACQRALLNRSGLAGGEQGKRPKHQQPHDVESVSVHDTRSVL